MVCSPEEVLADLDIQWQDHNDQTKQLKLALAAPELPLSGDEVKVLNLLHKGEALVDQIKVKTGIPIQRLNSLLLSMEFKNLLRQMPGKKYRKNIERSQRSDLAGSQPCQKSDFCLGQNKKEQMF